LGSRSAVEYVNTIMLEGTSAERQLRVFQETGDLKAVVRNIVSETRGHKNAQSSAHAVN
jgi:carboxylate-amine ligase